MFFPLAFSSTCTSELCELRDNLSLFKDSGVELIGISVDSKASLRAWAEAEGYDFTLLADFWPHGDVAKEYGVFIEEKGFANRATFLIDIDGTICEDIPNEEPERMAHAAIFDGALEACNRLYAQGHISWLPCANVAASSALK